MPQITDIITDLTFILLHFSLFLLSFKIADRSIIHPAALFSLLWCCILLFRFIFSFTILDQLYSITAPTYIIFLVGNLSFCIGSFIQTLAWQRLRVIENREIEITQDSIRKSLRIFLIMIVVVGIPFYIIAAYKLFIASTAESFLIGVRAELSYGDKNLGTATYLFPLAMVVYAFSFHSYLTEKNKLNTILFITSLLSVVIYTVFFTGRTAFLFIFVLYVGISYFYNKNFSLKRLSRMFLLFIFIFIFFGIFYGKGGNTQSTVAENLKPAAQSTAVYLVAGTNALDWELNHQYRISYNGYNSLRFFMKIGELVNLSQNIKVSDLVQPFVFVPYPTNVYTIYSPYIKEFWKLYAWIILSFFGFMQSYLYHKSLTKNLRAVLWYSFSLFPLLMSFFADQYLSLTSYWVQIAIFIEGIFLVNKFFVKKQW